MKSSVFGEAYAACYDLLYQEKDYEEECRLLERAFHLFCPFPVQKVLDLGCGTGNHAWRLAQRGFQVLGVDFSEPMLRIARRKKIAYILPSGVSPPLFLLGDITKLQLRIKFEAVMAMFAVLGYQTRDKDVAAFLNTVANHLKPGGLFVADIWYGPAVEAIKPESRRRVVSWGDGQLSREARGELIPDEHLCLVHYRINIQRNKDSKGEEFEEKHLMRYFFPEELREFLSEAGLKMVRLSAFGHLDQPPDPTTWNALVIAQKPKA